MRKYGPMVSRVQSGLVAAALMFAAAAHCWSQGHPPEQAAGKMTVPSGFTVSLVAAEPTCANPWRSTSTSAAGCG